MALTYLDNFIKKYEINVSHHQMGVPLYKRYYLEDTQLMASKNICWSDLMKDMGIRFSGNNILTVKRLIKKYNIDVSHFDSKLAARLNHPKLRIMEEIFCEQSTANRGTVKNRIEKLNLIPYKCNDCGISNEWNNKPIVLHLEHKNGVGNDNRLDNLCFLCPNCHSQTTTYAGRNMRGKKRAKDGSFISPDPVE